ncbi:alpha/beta fold hydrolase [Actinokineospora sp. HUAS TT18]|uniref:alpha/beta fold hydrolase n=1 Tax=Actinokineospora sp. HUAS TT18 TaxID=3447451 RepID=UPI003F51C0E0
MTRLTTFTNDGLTFDVIDEGPLDGEPIVLLHGWPQTATEWERVTPLLHERGYRTIAPTQRGYSRGARPRWRWEYRMSKLVGDTAALVEAIGAPVHLVGHDWGSTVAWSMAARNPAMVRSLTSVSVPHPMAFMRSLLSSPQVFRSWYMLAFQIPWLPELFLRQRKQLSRGLAKTGMDNKQIAHVLDGVVDSGALKYSVHWYRAMFIANPFAVRRNVSVPTTHIRGTRDRFITRQAADLTSRYVTGPYRLEVLDASHWIPEERPTDLASIIAATIDGSRDLACGLKSRPEM